MSIDLAALTDKTTLAGTELVILNDGGTAKDATVTVLSSFVAATLKAAVNVFTKNQSVTPASLTSGASIAVDASLSNSFKLTLGINATLANPTNLTDGMELKFRIKQDATGSRTLAYGSKYKFVGGVVPALSTAANSRDFLTCFYDSTDDVLLCTLQKAYA